MPIAKYFRGKGRQIMKAMKNKYGNKKGKSIFYATAKKQGLEPSDEFKRKNGLE